MGKVFILHWSVTLQLLALSAHGYPHGAPDLVCNSLLPEEPHPRFPSVTPSPYSLVIPSQQHTLGEQLSVSIAGTRIFRGFFIQVRNASVNNFDKFGIFTASAGSKTRCANQALTQTEANAKQGITFTWTATAMTPGLLVFRAIVMEDEFRYWLIASQPLTIVRRTIGPNPGIGGPATGPITPGVILPRPGPITPGFFVPRPGPITPGFVGAPNAGRITPGLITPLFVQPRSPRITPLFFGPRRITPQFLRTRSFTTTTSVLRPLPAINTPAVTGNPNTRNGVSSTRSQAAEGCGVSVGCFWDPQGRFDVTWSANNGQIDFKVGADVRTGRNRWVAIGFSHDQSMGDDSVIDCILFNDRVRVRNSYNQGTDNIQASSPQIGLSNPVGIFNNGRITCDFRRAEVIGATSTSRRKRQTSGDVFSLNQSMFLMVAIGNVDENGLKIHHSFDTVTTERVNFRSVRNVAEAAESHPLVKAHGALMVLAWILFSCIGIPVARHYKPMWPNSTIFRLKIWFQVHRSCMLMTVLLNCAAFIIIFVEAGGSYSRIPSGTVKASHPPLGIIVTILTIINPVMAFFRPGPNDDRRLLFYFAHWGVGMCAQVLAVFCIGVGVTIEQSNLPIEALWTTIGFAVYLVIINIILEVTNIPEPDDEPISGKYEMQNISNNLEENSGSRPTTVYDTETRRKLAPLLRSVLLGVHILVTVAFAFILVAMIAVS